ncbi:MAG: VOC family protein [Chloroflexota bacterium]
MTTSSLDTSITSIDPATDVGLLSLTVADLARSVTFYTQALGFAVLDQNGQEAALGVAGTSLLLLSEQPAAQPWPRGGDSYSGLYHFAILLPTRTALGQWLRHWLELGLPMPGQGDHLVSEALYLEDPDGHGIEIYRDRPRDQWRWHNGQVRMAVDPVDVRGLLSDADRAGDAWTGLPAGTRLGHMHLQVGDIDQAMTFYHDILGFDVVASMPSALFVSAGGYHHHIGMNTWHSRGVGRAPAGMVGLHFFTIDFATDAARQATLAQIEAAGIPVRGDGDVVTIEDPWQTRILLRVRSTTTE